MAVSMALTVGGLFSGIGGFELGLVRAGFEIIWMVEIDKFCQKVLKKHVPTYWPNVKIYGDIKNVGKENLRPPDVIVGGFPCQPFSSAGKRRGKEDDRYLWPEMLRIIRELKPRWIIGENVAGFISMELENAFIDLEAEGYKVEAFVLPANAVELHHRRNRIWIMAYTQKDGLSGQNGKQFSGCDESKIKQGRMLKPSGMDNQPSLFSWQNTNGGLGMGRGDIKPPILRVANGLSSRLDKDRIGALGNAVVPQIPEILGRCILEIEAEL